ncbi:aldose epimerase family protein [Flavobacterium sp.]|jgi:aldose 1-epimerase|uniref:aldose epimerase family protein n=1 Tax=Flavobacterium sp. TaxID=239 RepID=UPI0037BF1F3D
MIEKKHFSQVDYPEKTKSFGITADGREVFSYTLTNKNGMELEVMEYGATITSIKIPTASNSKIDVVLGFDTLQDYINSYDLPSAPYLGCVVGRVAGRINKGAFLLNEKKVQLTQNHGKHQLHGGKEGFGQKIWKMKNRTQGDFPSITLEYASQNGEENFPGVLVVEVTYMLTESNQVIVEYNAFSTDDTVVNLTQHSYFNLDGHQHSVSNQTLFVNSTKVLETNAENIPTGLFLKVSNCPFDFTEEKNCPPSIDNTFTLNEKNRIATSLYSKKNQLKMSVYTNQPAVHIYVGGNCFGQLKGKENADYHPLSGICFETQHYPDSPNHAHFPTIMLRKGEQYYHQTIFAFENI